MREIQERAKAIVQNFSLEQKIGQLFMLAFPGKDPEKIRPLMDKYNIGACYMSQENAETFDEAIALNKTLQSYAKQHHPEVPLLLGVDQEGAWGVLIPESVIGPGNLALGAANDEKLTEAMHYHYGQEMLYAGFNCLLTPCSDINLNPDTPIIGTRSFGEKPEEVGKHVVAAIRGGKQAKVLTTAKHFPGHGDTSGDTHREIPVVDKSLECLKEQDLYPFQQAVDAGVDLIMTSHIRYPQIDPDNPATLSKVILQDLLRDQMGFKGLIVTDSMNMGAIRKNYEPAESVLLALRAGANLIMLSEEHYDHSENYLQKQIDSVERILRAVREGEIPESLIDEQVESVIAFKLERLTPLVQATEKPETAPMKAVEKEAAEKAITLVIDRDKQWPLSREDQFVCVNATPQTSYKNLMNVRGIGPNQAVPAFEYFQEELSKWTTGVTWLNHEQVHGEEGKAVLASAERIVLITEDYPLPGEDFEQQEQQALVQEIITKYGKRVIVVGLRSAYEVKHYPDISCYCSSFSSRPCSAKAAAKALLGLIPAEGTSPVTLAV